MSAPRTLTGTVDHAEYTLTTRITYEDGTIATRLELGPFAATFFERYGGDGRYELVLKQEGVYDQLRADGRCEAEPLGLIFVVVDQRFETALAVALSALTRAAKASDLPQVGAHAAARHGDPETSKDAARSLDPNVLTDRQGEVLGAFRKHGPQDFEALIARLRALGSTQTDQSIRSRTAELRRKGLVRDTGKRTKLATGRRAAIWSAAPVPKAATVAV